MNIKLRLQSLEAREAVKDGVFLIVSEEDGKCYSTKNGKKKRFRSVDDAKAALYEKYGNPVIIIVDL